MADLFRYEPRALGYTAEPAMYMFYDIAPYGLVTKQTQVVRLSYALTKNKEFWDQVTINTPFAAQIINDKGPQPELKDEDSYNFFGAKLCFGIIKGGYAPAIRLRIEIRREKDVEAIQIAFTDFEYAPIQRHTQVDKPKPDAISYP